MESIHKNDVSDDISTGYCKIQKLRLYNAEYKNSQNLFAKRKYENATSVQD